MSINTLKFTLILLLTLLIPGIASAQMSDRQKIMKALNKQVECWNNGDLDCFMTAYWQSDSLKFIGSSGVTYGWENTLERYRKVYPDRQAMGKLKFEILSNEPVGKTHYFMIGKYFLTREIGDLNGIFSLVWKKTNGDWVIIADHTSAGN